MYREAFWVAVSAAAPVIALAAVVAYADANDLMRQVAAVNQVLTDETLESDDKLVSRYAGIPELGLIAVSLCIANLGLQAVTLTFSLVSLANGRNEGPTWAVLVAEVGGIVALAFAAVASQRARRRLADLHWVAGGKLGSPIMDRLYRLMKLRDKVSLSRGRPTAGTPLEPQGDRGTPPGDARSPSPPQ